MGAIAARVTRLKRDQAKAVERRRPNVRTLDAGRLLSLVPRISPQLHEPEHLEPIADEIEKVGDGQTIEICFSVPPRHGKTTLLIHAIVWLLMRDPTITILYASYAHGFASKQVRKAMRLAQRAGVAMGDVQRRDEWTTAAGGGVKAAGVGGQITGEGFRVVIVDDPHKNRAEASSRRIREKVIDGFLTDIYTRQDPRGTSVIVCHTRWHELDLIGSLTAPAANDEGDAPEPFRLINLAAITSANDGNYGTQSLAPKLFSLEKMLRIRARVGEFTWASLYMGSPRPRGGLLFGDVTLIEGLEETGTYRYAIGIDIAHTARTRSDWNVAVVMRVSVLSQEDRARGMTPRFDVVEVARHQGTLSDRVEGRGEAPEQQHLDDGFLRKLHALTQRYPGAPVVMYCSKDETLIVSLVARHDKYPVRIRATVVDTDKWKRAQPYGSAWNDPVGRVRVPRKAAWASSFIAEHVAFTGDKGERDDQVDAAASAWDELARGGAPRTRAKGSGAGSKLDGWKHGMAA